MVYIALLRGINVGGKNKVDMKSLKSTFEEAGMEDVSTYINSGNIIFRSKLNSTQKIADKLEASIEKDFGFAVKVLVLSKSYIKKLEEALPDEWVNDRNIMKCDVMFIWSNFDKPEVMDILDIREGVDNVVYQQGAIFWQVDKDNIGKSRLTKLIGSELYKNMTVRNVNTLRKVNNIMSLLED